VSPLTALAQNLKLTHNTRLQHALKLTQILGLLSAILRRKRCKYLAHHTQAQYLQMF
jgi:hypothetical protein